MPHNFRDALARDPDGDNVEVIFLNPNKLFTNAHRRKIIAAGFLFCYGP